MKPLNFIELPPYHFYRYKGRTETEKRLLFFDPQTLLKDFEKAIPVITAIKRTIYKPSIFLTQKEKIEILKKAQKVISIMKCCPDPVLKNDFLLIAETPPQNV